MKFSCLIVLLGTAYIALAHPVHDVGSQVDQAFNEVSRDPAFINYFLFTRRNPTASQLLLTGNTNSITSSNFNPSHPVVVIVHGFLGSDTSDPNILIRNALLNRRETNVINVNWQRIGASDALYGTPTIGRFLGQFLRFLNQVTGAPFRNMHLIGFSLGAHLVASAGRELGGQVARITGLDPAGSVWQYHPERLRASDAIYVEGIHTDVVFGIHDRVGDVDFFPNGGSRQPGCWTFVCNHNRSFEYYAATVTYNHILGRQCDNMQQMSANNCFGSTLPMGNDDLNKRGSGIFRVNTGSIYPF